jgi:phasin family protein
MKNQAITAQAEEMMVPVREMGELALDNTEKLVKLQVTAFTNYAKLGIAHWRAALAVRDADGAKEFMTKHRAYVETVTEKAAKDANAVMELGNDYVAEVQRVLKVSAEKVGVSKAA